MRCVPSFGHESPEEQRRGKRTQLRGNLVGRERRGENASTDIMLPYIPAKRPSQPMGPRQRSAENKANTALKKRDT